jgi:L-ascorbate metabolism protein UlaG (beta-lactamase superfamily)
VHLGGVRFPVSGPVRYTMTARDAVELCLRMEPDTVIPVHCEGWRHFREDQARARERFAAAPAGVRDRVRWLVPGEATEVAA